MFGKIMSRVEKELTGGSSGGLSSMLTGSTSSSGGANHGSSYHGASSFSNQGNHQYQGGPPIHGGYSSHGGHQDQGPSQQYGGYDPQANHAPPPGPPQGDFNSTNPPNNYYAPPAPQQNYYQPPPGPPPGSYQGPPHDYHGPPPGSHYSQPQSYQSPPPYDSPHGPPHGASQSPSSNQSRPSRIHNFPTKFHVWNETSNLTGDTFFVGGTDPKRGEFSGRMPNISGRFTVKTSSGQLIGEAKDSGLGGGSSVITLSSGFSCDFKKHKTLASMTFSFTCPAGRDGQPMTFIWKKMSLGGSEDIMLAMVGGGKGWVLVRQGDENQPLAKFSNDDGTKSSGLNLMVGEFAFCGPAATGELGPVWTTVAVVSILKMQAKLMEKQIIKIITGI